MPFSKGARGCIRKEMAMLMNAKAVVAVLGVWNLAAAGTPKGKSLLEMQYEEYIIAFTQIAEN